MASEFDRFLREAQRQRGNFFDRVRPITLARAPLWVDLLGGVLPAAGSLALGWPLAASSFIALQPDPAPTLTLWDGEQAPLIIPLAALTLDDGWPREYAELAALVAEHAPLVRLVVAAWAALYREEFARFPGGARLLIHPADGPAWQVSAVAAIAQSFVSAFGVRLAPRELALAVRSGLSHVAASDPGYLAALVSVCAQGGSALLVHQQPAWLWGAVHLPAHTALYSLRVTETPQALTAGPERPALAAGPLGAAEAVAMAYRIAADALGLSGAEADRRWRGHLANLGVVTLACIRSRLPELISGADFIQHYGSLPGFELQASGEYPVRAAAALAVEEHVRARTAVALLRAAGGRGDHNEELALIGELMLQSHEAQRAVGLSDPHAERLAELIHATGPAQGFYGVRQPALATGASLVVLGSAEAAPRLRSIVENFAVETGLPVTVFGGSASGCSPAGTREI